MILIYSSVLAAVAVILLIAKVKQRNRQRQQMRWLIQWLQQLRGLLEIFPKHRGMANAYLKGDHSFRPAMEKLQQEADAKLRSMHRLSSQNNGSVRSLLKPIEEQWQTIKEKLLNMPAKQSFALHSKLIALVIERMEDDSLELIAFTRSFSHEQDYLHAVITMLARELPQVVESIGQARGIGTGVAAQRCSSVDNLVNLKYLHSNTLSIIENKLLPLRSVLQHHNLKDARAYIDDTVSSAQEFLDSLKHELIDAQSPSVSPEVYYQRGTVAIDAGFRLFDKLFPRCTQLLGL